MSSSGGKPTPPAVQIAYENLISMTTEQLVEQFEIARYENDGHSAQFWLNELTRRATDRAAEATLALTARLSKLTVVLVLVAVLTLGAGIAAAVAA
jgi:mevalonate pyrophosphate decarboxylase